MRYGCVVLALMAFGARAEVAGSAVTVGASTEINSRYVWRGITLSRGAVQQSSVWLSSHDVSLSLWANMPLGHEEGRWRTNEVDYSVSAEKALGTVSITPTLIRYTYPNLDGAVSTTEAGIRFAVPLGPVAAYTEQSVDAGAYRGAYFGEAGVTAERALSPRWASEATARFGWANRRFNAAYIGPRKRAASLVALDLSASYDAGRGVTVSPRIAWSTVPDRILRSSLDRPSGFWFGLSVQREQ